MLLVENKHIRKHKGNINLPYKKYPNSKDNTNNNNIIINGLNIGNISCGLSCPNIDNSPPNMFLQNIESRMQRYYES
jgi:hypothetical protein